MHGPTKHTHEERHKEVLPLSKHDAEAS
jgi:hypothetical protein